MPCDLEVGPSRSQYPHELAYEPWSSMMLVVVGITRERRAPGAAVAMALGQVSLDQVVANSDLRSRRRNSAPEPSDPRRPHPAEVAHLLLAQGRPRL